MGEIRNQIKTFDIVISGYGTSQEETIAGYQIDSKGMIQKLWKAQVDQASYVTRWEDYLFTVTETDEYCIVYLLKRNKDEYFLLDQKKLDGGALCHITYSAKHHVLYGACYTTGTVFGVQVEEDHFGDVIFSEIQHSPSHKSLTRAHCVLLNSREDKLITVNIALDEVISYELKDGVPVFLERLALPEGVGPRHICYSPDETLIYVITEYSNEIFVYNTQGYQLLQRISTLPPEYSGTSNCSTLCMTKDGRHLYTANRGADTITVFRVTGNGELEWIKDYSCGGKHPRHMLLTDQDEMLIICNQYSNNITAYTLNGSTGELREKVLDFEFKTPSGIVQL
jgi:6-phosphogluconolactonase